MSENIANDKRSVSPEGFMLADAILATTGPLPYLRSEFGLPGDDSKIFYLNKPRKALESALPSFAGAPITMEHPGKLLTDADAKNYVVGAVAGTPTIDKDGNVRGTIRIFDRDAIRKIQRGEDQLSPGFDFAWGRIGPDDGDIATMKINHVAIVSKGRAGPPVRVLDHLPEQLEVLQMSNTAGEEQKQEPQAFDAQSVADALRTAFDSALNQKTAEGTDFEKAKSDVLASVMEKMQPALDAMIGFNQAQEKAKADAAIAEADKERKAAMDAAVAEAVKNERERHALIGTALKANDSLKAEELAELEQRDILVKAIGDSFPVEDGMSVEMLGGVLKGIVAVKDSASPASQENSSITPPPPAGAVPAKDDGKNVMPAMDGTVNLDKYNKRFAESMPQGRVQ